MIIARPTIKKTIIEFDNAMGTDQEIAMIGLEKGDLIVFRGEGDPVRLPADSAAGKMLVTDPTSETGWTLVNAPDTLPAEFENGSSSTLNAGMIVKVNSSGKIVRAGNKTYGQLYIVADDVFVGETVTCYGVPGTVANVLCSSGAVAIGDKITIASTSGYGCKKTNNEREIGIALEAKASGSTGLVKVRLLDGIAMTNTSSMLGGATVLEIVDGNTVPMGSVVTPTGGIASLAGEHSKMLFVTSADCEPGDSVICYGIPGTICYALCTESAVAIGDKLGPYSSYGDIESPSGKFAKVTNGRAAAIALSAKSSGSVGLVKVLLSEMMNDEQQSSGVIRGIPGTLDAYPFAGNIYWTKIGYTVHIDIPSITLNSALSDSTSIDLCTLPAELQPDNEVYFYAGRPITSGGIGGIQINQSGKLTFYKPGAVATWATDMPIRASVTYLTHK